jgi:hypothetical protein
LPRIISTTIDKRIIALRDAGDAVVHFQIAFDGGGPAGDQLDDA